MVQRFEGRHLLLYGGVALVWELFIVRKLIISHGPLSDVSLRVACMRATYALAIRPSYRRRTRLRASSFRTQLDEWAEYRNQYVPSLMSFSSESTLATIIPEDS